MSLGLMVIATSIAASSQNAATTSSLQKNPFGMPLALYSETLLPGADPQNRLGWTFAEHLASDQRQFWLKPRSLTKQDAHILLPLAAFSGLMVGSDHWITAQVPDKPGQLAHSQSFSNYGMYSLVGVAGSTFLWGQVTHNDHMREAGLLSGEAAINATAVSYALKGITQRSRPSESTGSLLVGSSFPSEHAAIAWSVASVMAHEYPGPLTQILAYGLASAVTVTRVTGKQHFASDAFIGSVLGWYMGRQVYRAHHDPDVGGGPWDSLHITSETPTPRSDNLGSPYVLLDSWVYSQFDRLAALGLMQSGYADMRPWTRLECARLVEEVSERIGPDVGDSSPAHRIYDALAVEFSPERRRLDGDKNVAVSMDSVYTRMSEISGTPLRDGFHFAQTLSNDYGRPYGEGLNTASGITAHAVAGSLWFSVQGEYQHAPATASYAPAVQQAIANLDGTMPLGTSTGTVDRFVLLNAAVGITFKNVNVSFGRESAWLGPTQSGPLLFSDNAAPITMLRIDSVSPYHIPLLSSFLGPARTEFFIGQLSGQQWVFANTHLEGPDINPQPFVHGNKISFKPTPNLEFGMGLVAMFGGPGLPFTWGNFLRTYYSHKTSIAENPGKRFSAFDFSYRIPGLRNWLTFYTDSLVVDEISPIGSGRPSVNPGLYMPQVPKLPGLELRVEGITTSHSAHEFGPGFVYTDRRYRSGYTNDGNLIGNWIGRDGHGVQGWATYSFSPRNRVQFQYRHAEVDRDFLRGGHVNDFAVHSDWMVRPGLSFSSFLQYERWAFPLLAPQPQSNVTASFQFTYSPTWSGVTRKLQDWSSSTFKP